MLHSPLLQSPTSPLAYKHLTQALWSPQEPQFRLGIGSDTTVIVRTSVHARYCPQLSHRIGVGFCSSKGLGVSKRWDLLYKYPLHTGFHDVGLRGVTFSSPTEPNVPVGSQTPHPGVVVHIEATIPAGYWL